MTSKVTKSQREAAIVGYVHRNGDVAGLTVREIREGLRTSGWLEDAATLQAYHKTVSHLVSLVKLERIGKGTGPARYIVPRAWRVSLEDIADAHSRSAGDVSGGHLLYDRSALDPDAYAEYLHGQLVFRENGKRVLRLAARGLLLENPRDLVWRMFKHKVADFNRLVSDAWVAGGRGKVSADKVKQEFENLRRLVHSYYGVSCRDFPTGTLSSALKGIEIVPDWDVVRKALEHRVFGETVLSWVGAGGAGERPFVVGGSDGSSHSVNVSNFPGDGLMDQDGLVLTFNNSLAALKLWDELARLFDYPYHSVPLNRATFQDPQNAAMVLARVFFDDLTDVEYEHLKQAGLELVQCQVDERIVSGLAVVAGDGAVLGRGEHRLLPRPVVHFRDGPVTPQFRELMWEYYCAANAKGEWYRRLILLWLRMLQTVSSAERQVLVGVVKSTQMRAFSELVNWYVAFGSAECSISGKPDGEAIEPGWKDAGVWRLNDHQIMTQLLAVSVEETDAVARMSDGDYLCSCVILRPFPQLTADLRYLGLPDEGIVGYFEDQKRAAGEWRKRYPGDPHYLETVSSIADEPYVQMCRKADYCSFYVGHTGGEPALQLPRYEFVDTLRAMGSVEDMRRRITERVQLVVSALHDAGLSQDRDHNFMLNVDITRLVPFTVYDAHEKSKVWGDHLSKEFRSVIFERLAALRGDLSKREITFEPTPATEYIRRVERVLRSDPQPELF